MHMCDMIIHIKHIPIMYMIPYHTILIKHIVCVGVERICLTLIIDICDMISHIKHVPIMYMIPYHIVCFKHIIMRVV